MTNLNQNVGNNFNLMFPPGRRKRSLLGPADRREARAWGRLHIPATCNLQDVSTAIQVMSNPAAYYQMWNTFLLVWLQQEDSCTPVVLFAPIDPASSHLPVQQPLAMPASSCVLLILLISPSLALTLWPSQCVPEASIDLGLVHLVSGCPNVRVIFESCIWWARIAN